MKKNKAFLIAVIFPLIISILVSTSAWAQAGRGKGRLNGLVTDEQGHPLAGVKVTLQFVQEKGIQFETTTNKKGEWAFLGLGSGLWIITASAEGFIQATKEINVSQLAQNPKVSLVLKKIQLTEATAPTDLESLKVYDQATGLFNEGKYDEAATLLEELLAKNPSFYHVLINIGDCYREKGEFSHAIDKYNLAVEEAKKDEKWGKDITAKALTGIGECYLRQGDLESAQNYFRQALELSPDNETLAYNVGEIYFSNQKLEEALQYFSQAARIKPTWGAPYYKLGLIHLNRNDYEKARENLKKFLGLEPDSELAPTAKNILEYLEKIKKSPFNPAI